MILIFVVLDHFSKFPFLKPVKKFTAEAILKYLEEELIHCFGVPEVIVSDNGVQFKSHAFNKLLEKYKIAHSYTAIYSPQGNASERVNRTAIAAIKAYIHPSQNNWDDQLSKICCSLRSSWHTAINTTPYRLTFGQNMITNGSTYKLLKRLNLLEDRSVCFERDDSFDIERDKAITSMRKQHQRNENAYNLRAREVSFNVGQEVYRRNFTQSNFEKGYSAKLAPNFIKSRIKRKLGNSYYDVEDLNSHYIGRFHAKDRKQYAKLINFHLAPSVDPAFKGLPSKA